jgi:hypothetical protein
MSERNKLAEFYDVELANTTGQLFDALKEIDRLKTALKKIEDLAVRAESPAYKWGAAFAVATGALHAPGQGT